MRVGPAWRRADLRQCSQLLAPGSANHAAQAPRQMATSVADQAAPDRVDRHLGVVGRPSFSSTRAR
jgi:hypothetical protein